MRRFLLITHALLALLFAAILAVTFFARDYLRERARTFVTARTQKLVTPVVDTAEEALRGDFARRLLSADQHAALQAEIDEFHAQPGAYIQRLVADRADARPAAFLAKLSEKIYDWKERVRRYYQQVLGHLFTDIRIFSGTNVAAAIAAFICAWRSRGRPPGALLTVSALLLVAIGLCLFFYIDRFSVFTLLFDSHLGWWYPALLALHFLYLWAHAEPRS